MHTFSVYKIIAIVIQMFYKINKYTNPKQTLFAHFKPAQIWGKKRQTFKNAHKSHYKRF